MTKLVVEYLSVRNIYFYEKNTKVHDEKQIIQIADSIECFGFNNPVIVDENGVLLAGHGRLCAARMLDMDKIPVVRLTHLNEFEKKAYRIADNKLSELGKFDTDMLKLEFSDIEALAIELGEELSLDVTGFDLKDIDVIMNEDKSEEAKSNEKLENIPYISEDEIITQPGDIWYIGRHCIICGDALQKDTYKKLLDDEKAQIVFTDSPYNISVSKIGGKGKVKHSEFKMGVGELSSEQFTDFLKKIMENLCEYSEENSVHYLCMDWRNVFEMMSASKDVYSKMLNLLVWAKTNGGQGSFYRSKHELIFVFQNGTGSHINNIDLGKHGRYRCNVIECAGINSFGKEQNNLKMHPTVKPHILIADILLDASKRGGIVLDTFLGSESTLIAAEKTGRVCRGIEIEPKYVDTCIRRYRECFGLDAYRASDDRPYLQLLAERKVQLASHE